MMRARGNHGSGYCPGFRDVKTGGRGNLVYELPSTSALQGPNTSVRLPFTVALTVKRRQGEGYKGSSPKSIVEHRLAGLSRAFLFLPLWSDSTGDRRSIL
jgi:hypothetical protein